MSRRSGRRFADKDMRQRMNPEPAFIAESALSARQPRTGSRDQANPTMPAMMSCITIAIATAAGQP